MSYPELLSSDGLYPNERAVLRVFALVDEPMGLENVTQRLRSGATPRLAVGVEPAIKMLDALGYLDVVEWTDNRPSRWAATSFGRLAWEQMA